MSDKQFSIAAPWEKPGDKPTRVMIDCFGGGEYFITVRDQKIRFEWSDQFGPLPIKKGGAEMTGIGPRHPFWRAASLWNLQGRRIDDEGNAVWHEPRQPVYEKRHLGGGNYWITRVIDEGEPGHDW